jgi:hypothetical protein
MRASGAYGTSPVRDRVTVRYGELHGCASDEAAHQRMRKVVRDFLDLVTHFAREGAAARIARLRVVLDEAARREAACTSDHCLLDHARAVHRADQAEDTARFELPLDLTPAAEERLLRATYVEIAHLQGQASLLEARKEARHA